MPRSLRSRLAEEAKLKCQMAELHFISNMLGACQPVEMCLKPGKHKGGGGGVGWRGRGRRRGKHVLGFYLSSGGGGGGAPGDCVNLFKFKGSSQVGVQRSLLFEKNI